MFPMLVLELNSKHKDVDNNLKIMSYNQGH